MRKFQIAPRTFLKGSLGALAFAHLALSCLAYRALLPFMSKPVSPGNICTGALGFVIELLQVGALVFVVALFGLAVMHLLLAYTARKRAWWILLFVIAVAVNVVLALLGFSSGQPVLFLFSAVLLSLSLAAAYELLRI